MVWKEGGRNQISHEILHKNAHQYLQNNKHLDTNDRYGQKEKGKIGVGHTKVNRHTNTNPAPNIKKKVEWKERKERDISNNKRICFKEKSIKYQDNTPPSKKRNL